MAVRVVEGVVQHYAWGDRAFIPKMLGVAGRGEPWAELWLGTHPNGPTTLEGGAPLRDLSGELPYLLKVLAAAEPLSLQTHPTAAQAEAGHASGVFGDPYPKPELLVALTEFEALCGVRPEAATVALLRSVGAAELADVVETAGAGEAMRQLYRAELSPATTIAACRSVADSSDDCAEAAWVRALDDRYPGEASVAVALLLNHVVLEPGEAIHLTAGNLHGYLNGAGIELMRASDNVVRGGLTVKEVDIDLLLDTVDPTPLAEPVMNVVDGRYPLPEAGVVLVRLEPGDSHRAVGHELLIAVDGTSLYLSPGTEVHADSPAYVVTPG
ncbi:MAG: mannose-6-phosphate isomerase, class I [Ilumatobacter sp.]